MEDPVYIEKIKPDPDGLDYEGLKQAGITLLQDLSGKVWTDYNLHDPGVTILEALCYALTDLVYRTDIDVVDYLTAEDGFIDFEKQALFRPEDIFPSQTITLNDYRKLIIDAIPEIENVWISTLRPRGSSSSDNHPQGLYCISVALSVPAYAIAPNGSSESQGTDIIEHVKRIYAANRNLGEDLLQVNIVEPDYYGLQGSIEIGGHRNPDDILAEIYFKTSKFLCPGLDFQAYDDMLRQGTHLEELFSGPLTHHGYISTDELNRHPEYAQISDLIAIIGEIEGITYIDSLWFDEGLGFIEYDRTLQSMPYLRLPKSDTEIALRLEKNGRIHTVNLEKVLTEYERLGFEERALRYSREDFSKICAPPHGKNRNLGDYYSIQNEFPAAYGIGRYSLSPQPGLAGKAKAESDKRQARAKQLKAYLVLFDQIMANYLANLQDLQRLFSLDENLDRSYSHQLIDNTVVPAIEEIYRDKASQIDAKLARLLRRHDNFSSRRNRILDYLLGIYAESFTQNSLRRFNAYHSESAFAHEMILNKITLLKEIRTLSRNRAGAFNYLAPAWDTQNSACLQKKVNILLGIRNVKTRSLARQAEPIDCEGCHVLEHILLRPLAAKTNVTPPPDDFYDFKISVLFPAWTPRFKDPEFRKLAEETVRLNCPAHVSAVFYWLDFEFMSAFEALYKRWMDLKCSTNFSQMQVDEYALRLVRFLLKHSES